MIFKTICASKYYSATGITLALKPFRKKTHFIASQHHSCFQLFWMIKAMQVTLSLKTFGDVAAGKAQV